MSRQHMNYMIVLCMERDNAIDTQQEEGWRVQQDRTKATSNDTEKKRPPLTVTG